MKSRHLRVWLAAIVLLLSGGLLLVSAWPVSREQDAIALPSLTLPADERSPSSAHSQQPAIPEKRQIVIEEPAFLRVQDDDWVRLSLVVNEGVVTEATGLQVADLYSSHNVVAVARLELPSLGAWRQELREPLRPGRPVSFRWALRAEQPGVSRGVAWLSLEFVPLDGGEVQKVIVLSRQISIEAVTVLGLPAWVGRWAGGMGLAGSALYLLTGWWFSRRGAGSAQIPPRLSKLL